MLSTRYSCYRLFKIFHVSYVVLTRKTFFSNTVREFAEINGMDFTRIANIFTVWKDTILIVENQKSLSLKIILLRIKAHTFFCSELFCFPLHQQQYNYILHHPVSVFTGLYNFCNIYFLL